MSDLLNGENFDMRVLERPRGDFGVTSILIPSLASEELLVLCFQLSPVSLGLECSSADLFLRWRVLRSRWLFGMLVGVISPKNARLGILAFFGEFR